MADRLADSVVRTCSTPLQQHPMNSKPFFSSPVYIVSNMTGEAGTFLQGRLFQRLDKLILGEE